MVESKNGVSSGVSQRKRQIPRITEKGEVIAGKAVPETINRPLSNAGMHPIRFQAVAQIGRTDWTRVMAIRFEPSAEIRLNFDESTTGGFGRKCGDLNQSFMPIEVSPIQAGKFRTAQTGKNTQHQKRQCFNTGCFQESSNLLGFEDASVSGTLVLRTVESGLTPLQPRP